MDTERALLQLAWICAAFGLCGTCLGQTALPTTARQFENVPFAPLVRPTQFWVGWPRGAYFEADPQIPLFLKSRTSQLRSVKDSLAKGHGTGYTVIMLPHLVFRQSASGTVRSAPVLTPTFNPVVELSFFRLSTEPRGKRSWFYPSIATTSRTGELWTAQLRLAHYSNGQSGCLYASQSLQSPSSTCTPRVQPGAPLNTIDGSFSSHYVESTISKSWILFDRDYAERVMQTVGATGVPLSMRIGPAVGAGPVKPF